MALSTRLQQAKQLDMKKQNGLNQSQRQLCPAHLNAKPIVVPSQLKMIVQKTTLIFLEFAP